MSAIEGGSIEGDHVSLGAYVLGALNEQEAREFEAHLAECAACQAELGELNELRDQLGEVPPEAFLEGPPTNDLLLQRTLRQVREEGGAESANRREFSSVQRRPRLMVLAGAAVLVLVMLGVGVLLGRQFTSSDQPPQAGSSTTIPGTVNLAGSNSTGSIKLAASVSPASGWVRLHVNVQGVAEGEKCQLVVTSKTGEKFIAGSWVVSKKWENSGSGVDGSAFVAPDQVSSVAVQTFDGRTLVTASV